MHITDNFSLEEFTRTTTGLPNEPNSEATEYIIQIAHILQKVRDEYGQPINVTSGYRSKEVNEAVGGAKNSDHLYGAAADITCTRMDIVWEILCRYCASKKIQLRQLIWEYGTQYSPSWIHLSINNKHNKTKNNEMLFIGVKKI